MKRIGLVGVAVAALTGAGCNTDEPKVVTADVPIPPEANGVATTCSTSRGKVINATQELVNKVTGEEYAAPMSACHKGEKSIGGQETLGFTVPDATDAESDLALTDRFFQDWTACQRATALHTLEEGAAAGTEMYYTAPGLNSYPGGDAGRDAEKFYQKCEAKVSGDRIAEQEAKMAKAVAEKEAAAEAARPPTEFDEDNVATGTDTKGTYTDKNGGVLTGGFENGTVTGDYSFGSATLMGVFSVNEKGEVIYFVSTDSGSRKTLSGQFNNDHVKGTYALGGTQLEGDFQVTGNGEILPIGEVTITWPDNAKLTAQFVDGQADGREKVEYTDASGTPKTLYTYNNAPLGSPWVRATDNATGTEQEQEIYTLDKDFNMNITRKTVPLTPAKP